MSTRAIYSFDTDYGMVHVYKHHDGYPTGAADALKAAQAYAWPLPRYEGDDYAAAFVAANKIPYFLQPGLEALFGAPCEENTGNGCVRMRHNAEIYSVAVRVRQDADWHRWWRSPDTPGQKAA